MGSLTSEQKQLIFDYCIGLTSEADAVHIEGLISADAEAARIYESLKLSLSPLEALAPENCPDELAEATISRLNDLARSSHHNLEHLLATEQKRNFRVKSLFQQNFSQFAAVAAVLVFAAAVLLGPLKFARQKSWQNQCQAQLARISQGISTYQADHRGKIPAVAAAQGSPWWKVGAAGKENHSNTRPLWLLVKGDYVKYSDFVCPGKRQGRVIQLNPAQLANFEDFPDRRYITYSFRITCDKPQQSPGARNVLISDANPLFEKLPQRYSSPLKIRLNKNLLTANSINHNRRGQNVLFGDGQVRFTKTRKIGFAKDDIFTLKDTDTYKGFEVPSCETDAFLAP